MVDTNGLRRIGFILGTVAISVVLIAVALVHAHVDGQLTLDGIDRQAAPISSRS